jgi:hypothetical protein
VNTAVYHSETNDDFSEDCRTLSQMQIETGWGFAAAMAVRRGKIATCFP